MEWADWPANSLGSHPLVSSARCELQLQMKAISPTAARSPCSGPRVHTTGTLPAVQKSDSPSAYWEMSSNCVHLGYSTTLSCSYPSSYITNERFTTWSPTDKILFEKHFKNKYFYFTISPFRCSVLRCGSGLRPPHCKDTWFEGNCCTPLATTALSLARVHSSSLEHLCFTSFNNRLLGFLKTKVMTEIGRPLGAHWWAFQEIVVNLECWADLKQLLKTQTVNILKSSSDMAL